MLKKLIFISLIISVASVHAETVTWLERCETNLSQGRVNEALTEYQQVDSSKQSPEQKVVMAASLGKALSKVIA